MKLWFLRINGKTENIFEAFNIPFIVCGIKWDIFAQDDAENDIINLKKFLLMFMQWILNSQCLNKWGLIWNEKKKGKREARKEENDAILIFFIWCITFKAVT